MQNWTTSFRTLAGWIAAAWIVWTLPGQAEDYTWTGVNGGWDDTARWTPSGYPGSTDTADTASFTADTGRAIALNLTPAHALHAFTVAGSGAWTWSASWGTTPVLTVGDGNINFSGTSPDRSNLNVMFAGTGGLIMNSGVLNFGARWGDGSTFSGDVEIHGGVLYAGRWGSGGKATDIGTGTIYLGAAEGPERDAELWFSGPNASPIVVRSGNDGQASLGLHYGWDTVDVSSPVTLQKDLRLVSNERRLNTRDFPDRGILQLSGPISGTGNIIKEGIGSVHLAGANSYVGTTTFRGGFNNRLQNAAATFQGDIAVEYGRLFIANGEGSLAGNALRLGSTGGFGGFGATGTINQRTTVETGIELVGNGGMLVGLGDHGLQLNGILSGEGLLILHAGGGNARHQEAYFNADNTHSGGMIAVGGFWSTENDNNTIYGRGDIRVLHGAYLTIRGAENVDADATVSVRGGGILAVTTPDYLPAIDAASDGSLWMSGILSAGLNARFADDTQPIGTGTLRLGANRHVNLTFEGTSLAALFGHDPARTYRLHGGDGARIFILNALGVDGALKDLGGQSFHVDIAGGTRVELYDDNPFSGTLSVRGTTVYAYTPDETGNPLGDDAGAVFLGEAQLRVINRAQVTRTVSKGELTFDGDSLIRVDADSATPSWTTSFELGGLLRRNGATLDVAGLRDSLGVDERVKVAGGVPSVNGMVAPYFWNSAALSFLDYDESTGFTVSPWSRINDLDGGATERVHLTGATAVPGGGASAYAVRAHGALTGGTLTVAGGGLLLTAAATHTAPLSFGTSEALLLVTDDNTIEGALSGSGGLTKSGSGKLNLRGDNSGLSGGITVQQGILTFTDPSHLGADLITLNGGRLEGDATATVNNDVHLGAGGGTLAKPTWHNTVTYAGNISGAGVLTLRGGVSLTGANNTYSGGTIMHTQVSGGGGVVAAGSSLGSGPITLHGQRSHFDANGPARLILQGSGNTSASQTMELRGPTAVVNFQATEHVIGELTGGGVATLGLAGTSATTLRVGGLNTDSAFFGTFQDADMNGLSHTHRGGVLIKEGTATYTLWGEGYHTGGTTVDGGTLVVNNWNHPEGGVTVNASGTLGGIGTVGSTVVNNGGTLAPGEAADQPGTLVVRGDLTLEAGSTLALGLRGPTDHGTLSVEGDVTLGGALDVTLLEGYIPSVGGTFEILSATGTVDGSFDSLPADVQVTIEDGRTVVLEFPSRGTILILR